MTYGLVGAYRDAPLENSSSRNQDAGMHNFFRALFDSFSFSEASRSSRQRHLVSPVRCHPPLSLSSSDHDLAIDRDGLPPLVEIHLSLLKVGFCRSFRF